MAMTWIRARRNMAFNGIDENVVGNPTVTFYLTAGMVKQVPSSDATTLIAANAAYAANSTDLSTDWNSGGRDAEARRLAILGQFPSTT